MGVEGLEHTNILFMKDNKPVCYIFGSVYELKFYITLCDPNTDGDRSVYKNSEHILFSVGHDWDWIELRLLQYQ